MNDIFEILSSKKLKTPIQKQFAYFHRAMYPEFENLTLNASIDDKKKLLEKKYKAVRNCFSNADYKTFS